MTRLFPALATASFLTVGLTAPAPTHAEITTLSECYDAVLTWCNANFPEMNCANSSGLDQCDEEFGDSSENRPSTGTFQTEILSMQLRSPPPGSSDEEPGLAAGR